MRQIRMQREYKACSDFGKQRHATAIPQVTGVEWWCSAVGSLPQTPGPADSASKLLNLYYTAPVTDHIYGFMN